LPEDDPQAESLRLLELGRESFAAGEYGRAAERFRRAAAADPRQVVAHFLLTQALFALGKYPAAVDAAVAGLALAPDWPATPFRPLELYGTNVADYSEHLRRLAEALRLNPDDPDFLFLYAYQLWFDGRRDEARLLFERARRHGADPVAIDRFLMALPAGPVL
jgi:tetratricopeptide (TPR) repeat protein